MSGAVITPIPAEGTGGAGASVADSRLAASLNDAVTLTADGALVTIDGLNTDAIAGTDITFDGDLVTIVTEGIYYIACSIQCANGHTTTKVAVTASFGVNAAIAGGNGSSLGVYVVPAADGELIAAQGTYRLAAGTTITFRGSAFSATDAALSWFGADIIRLA